MPCWTGETGMTFTSMGHNRPPRSFFVWNQAAFSMIEVLVTIAVFGIVLLSLYSGITNGFAFVELTRENLRATQIMEEKMETIRLYRWSQITQSGFIPTNFVVSFCPFKTQSTAGLTYTGTVSIVDAPISEFYSDDLKQVTITIAWTSGNALRQRRMTSFVAQYGLQNYVY